MKVIKSNLQAEQADIVAEGAVLAYEAHPVIQVSVNGNFDADTARLQLCAHAVFKKPNSHLNSTYSP